MTNKRLAPGKEAQYYAFLAIRGMKPEEAMKIVEENTFEEVNKKISVEYSINSAKKGIEKYLIQDGEEIEIGYITGEKEATQDYYYGLGDKIVVNFDYEEQLCDAIIKVVAEIHDKWVVENAHKYGSDNDNYKHLPTALIGLEEFNKDLMFVAPFLKNMGYSVGNMTEKENGVFVSSSYIADAYQRYVEQYKEKHNIASEQDLIDHLKNITNTYESLSVSNAPEGKVEAAQKRAESLANATQLKLLVSQVQDKNSDSFVKDQAQPQ